MPTCLISANREYALPLKRRWFLAQPSCLRHQMIAIYSQKIVQNVSCDPSGWWRLNGVTKVHRRISPSIKSERGIWSPIDWGMPLTSRNWIPLRLPLPIQTDWLIFIPINRCLLWIYRDHFRSICAVWFLPGVVGNGPGSSDPGLKSWQGFGQVQSIGPAFLTNRFNHFSFSLPGLMSLVFQHLMTASSGCSLISSPQPSSSRSTKCFPLGSCSPVPCLNDAYRIPSTFIDLDSLKITSCISSIGTWIREEQAQTPYHQQNGRG